MTRKKYQTPKSVYKAVCERSGGSWEQRDGDGQPRCYGGNCEVPGCQAPSGDFRGLQFAHWEKHRKMGGTTDPEVHSADNIKRCCAVCHDKKDKRN